MRNKRSQTQNEDKLYTFIYVAWGNVIKKTGLPSDLWAGPWHSGTPHLLPVLGMWVLLVFPALRGCSKDIALRQWCGVENTCTVYTTEDSQGLFTNLQDLEGSRGDLFILLRPKTGLTGKFPLLSEIATYQPGVAGPFFHLSPPPTYGGPFRIIPGKLPRGPTYETQET